MHQGLGVHCLPVVLQRLDREIRQALPAPVKGGVPS